MVVTISLNRNLNVDENLIAILPPAILVRKNAPTYSVGLFPGYFRNQKAHVSKRYLEVNVVDSHRTIGIAHRRTASFEQSRVERQREHWEISRAQTLA